MQPHLLLAKQVEGWEDIALEMWQGSQLCGGLPVETSFMNSGKHKVSILNQDCCALCPGVVDWHNCGIVLGVLESGLGIGWNKYLNSVTLYVGMGPL